MAVLTKYKYLEPKRHKEHTRQLGLKGRNMTVWNLVANIVVSEREPAEVVRSFDLPPEAVWEALDYYYENREMIHAEVEATGERLRELGLLKD